MPTIFMGIIADEDQNSVLTELNVIEREHGALTLRNVVAVAKQRSSALHKYFVWGRRGTREVLYKRARDIVSSIYIVDS